MSTENCVTDLFSWKIQVNWVVHLDREQTSKAPNKTWWVLYKKSNFDSLWRLNGFEWYVKGWFTQNFSLLALKLFQTCMSFTVLLNTKEDVLKNVDASNWRPYYFIHSYINCLVTNILKNIFFCVQQRKGTCLEQNKGK